MIVPRAFAAHSHDLSEKVDLGGRKRSTRPRNATRSRSPFSTSPAEACPPPARATVADSRSEPVKIPLRKESHAALPASRQRPLPLPVQDVSVVKNVQAKKPRKESVYDVLSATAIPMRRKPRGRPSQRLPNCDHVADFSRLLMDDISPSNESSLSRSNSSPHLDNLFGNIDELVDGQMIVGSENVDESILTIRSPPTSESDVSLASPDDFSIGEAASQQSLVSKSFQDRRSRQVASSEDCGSNHPLLSTTEDEEVVAPSLPASSSPRSTPPAPGKKVGSFKSSLTASLKAIKSAAQSVSVRSHLFTSAESNSMARQFFDIQPFLTDDRRPPPNSKPPSPELRRYLNPYTAIAPPDSPAQLHFWQDDGQTFSPKNKKSKGRRKSSKKTRTPSPSAVDSLPSVVQLATCLPPSVRTAHASSPPIWLAPDGTPSNKQTANSLLYDPDVTSDKAAIRTREPRENRDFLRVFVCEMEMRRRGKLSDDLNTGRAKLWLPPVGDAFKGRTSIEGDNNQVVSKPLEGAEKWKAWTADDL